MQVNKGDGRLQRWWEGDCQQICDCKVKKMYLSIDEKVQVLILSINCS